MKHGKKIKILNTYAGIGGNRKLWGDEHEITAVENDKDTANIYQEFYPNDIVIVGDAMDYIRHHYKEFDIIWASPPCPTHSRINTTMVGTGATPRFAEMSLYQIIIFLKQWFKGKYIVENVIPYYEPLIPAKKIDRHLWWCNFNIGNFTPTKKPNHETATVKQLEEFYEVDLSKFKPKGKNTKLKMLRNMVHPETGKYVLDCALGIWSKKDYRQMDIYDLIK